LDATFPTRLVTGIQPTTSLHLGQYFGAIASAVTLHDQFAGDCFYFIADYHALTRPWDGKALRTNSEHVARGCLALGLDPERARIYRQSDVPQTCELAWMLACVASDGRLRNSVVFKSSVEEEKLLRTSGLYLYPVLQAADILGLRGTWIPAGQNQDQTVEIAREIASRANEWLGSEIFPEPALYPTYAPKVLGTAGTAEMKHSLGNTLQIFAAEEELERQVRSIHTAPVPIGQPITIEGDLILHYLDLVDLTQDDTGPAAYVRTGYENATVGYDEAKRILFTELLIYFEEARDHYASGTLTADEIEEILFFGAAEARNEFDQTLEQLRDLVGLGPYTGRSTP
jgi:tryptophanyl-tRNA synthetase